jgi:hypothetical protein
MGLVPLMLTNWELHSSCWVRVQLIVYWLWHVANAKMTVLGKQSIYEWRWAC